MGARAAAATAASVVGVVAGPAFAVVGGVGTARVAADAGAAKVGRAVAALVGVAVTLIDKWTSLWPMAVRLPPEATVVGVGAVAGAVAVEVPPGRRAQTREEGAPIPGKGEVAAVSKSESLTIRTTSFSTPLPI